MSHKTRSLKQLRAIVRVMHKDLPKTLYQIAEVATSRGPWGFIENPDKGPGQVAHLRVQKKTASQVRLAPRRSQRSMYLKAKASFLKAEYPAYA